MNSLRHDATVIALLVTGLTFVGAHLLQSNLQVMFTVVAIQFVAIKVLAILLEPWA
jgi:hypothetical protein